MLDASQLGRRHLGAPFKPSLVNQLEEFGPGADDRSHRGGARRNHAAVGRQHAGLPALELLCAQHGLRSFGLGFGSFLQRQVLVDLLGAERTRTLQRAGAFGVGRRVRSAGLRIDQIGARLRHIGLRAVGRERGQHLPGFHHVTDIGHHLRQTQAVGLGPDDGFLPRGDVAVGGEPDGQTAGLRFFLGDGQGRFVIGHRFFVTLGGCGRPRRREEINGPAREHHDGQNDEDERPGS